jgi:heptosyltransferase-2
LKLKYPNSHVSWITKKNAAPIFLNNHLVDEVLVYEDNSALARLQSTNFNSVINTDASYSSAALATIANSPIKKGFVLNDLGRVMHANKDAIEWFEMGAFDEYKKQNKKSYQKIIHDIIGLEYSKSNIQLFLTDDEKDLRDKHFDEYKLYDYDFVIGLNTGAGGRWQFKQWTLDGYAELIEKMREMYNAAILLYGGPEEVERNRLLANKFPFLIDTGTNNSLREFFVKVDLSDLFITGDTMALHAATALNKKIICLFGPTSHHEIEDYGRIIKIYSNLDCLVCYKPRCDFVPNCMESISSNMIIDAVKIQVEKLIN